MHIKMILPALIEAKSPFWRPIKYSLFPPLGLATLAGHVSNFDTVEIVDEHVEYLDTSDCPHLVLIQVYITNAYRAYKIADFYRNKGCYVILGGLHVTALPDEAAIHADSIFTGPADATFPEFLSDFKNGKPKKVYTSSVRNIKHIPALRRDLIKRDKYLVPNSISVSRGCIHSCDFCYKDSFFKGGKSFYTMLVDKALEEIESLPGRHLYFLDDHLFADRRFISELFEGMRGMNRVFQGAATVQSVLETDLVEKATNAGLRSLFVGFETLNIENLKQSNKYHNLNNDYNLAIKRLHNYGVMINGSFVFGLDDDDEYVFQRTVEWAVNQSITTATFHILTPYPGTVLYRKMDSENRIISKNWDLYNTRNVVFKPARLTENQLQKGYDNAYREFYSWANIFKASTGHTSFKHFVKHLGYTGAWKKMEPLWNFIIKSGALPFARPWLEAVLSEIRKAGNNSHNITQSENENMKKSHAVLSNN